MHSWKDQVQRLGDPSEFGIGDRHSLDREGTVGAVVLACKPIGLEPSGERRLGNVVAADLPFAVAVATVPEEFVAADYALSGTYLDPQHTPAIGHVQESTGLGERLTAALLASPPELIARALDRARRQAGSIADYLVGCGVTCAELKALRSGLIKEGEEHHDGG